MKLRQRAVLRTVQRWAEIALRGKSSIAFCELCRLAKAELGEALDLKRSYSWCKRCPYVEVFGTRCVEEFIELEEYMTPITYRAREKLRRAMELAKQYGLQREALAIVREVVAEVRGG